MQVFRMKTKNIQFFIGVLIGFYIGLNIRANLSCEKSLIINGNGRNKVVHYEGSIITGVMTTKNYLTTRALASYNTWGKHMPGKVLYFTSEGSEQFAPEGIPVVGLKGVDDRYPPQKKSFLMMKYLYHFYGDTYEWFIRSDDDVYIKPDKIIKLLNSLNSSKVYYIGQPGFGRESEGENLKLKETDNYCMGGPGMIFSKETMRKLVPNISYCLKHLLYSTHEDVELGRCVSNVTNTSCTESYEMGQLFYHNYAEPKGSFTQAVKKSQINQAITLHPVKNISQQHRLHYYFQSIQAKQLRNKILLMVQEINNLNDIIAPLNPKDDFGTDNMFISKSGDTFPRSREYVIPWENIGSGFSLYSFKMMHPDRHVHNAYIVALVDIATQVKFKTYKIFKGLNKDSDARLINTRLRHAYHRVDLLRGAEYVLNAWFLCKLNKKKQVKKMQLYLRQSFTDIEFKEDTCNQNVEINQNAEGSQLKNLTEGSEVVVSKCFDVLHFILPLSGKLQAFLSYMITFERIVLKTEKRVVLAAVLFDDISHSKKEIITVIKNLSLIYPQHKITVSEMEGDFSRGKAINHGASLFDKDALLVFTDVDLTIDHEALWRFRKTAIQGRQVYFPIFFSQYYPNISCDSSCQNSQLKFHNQIGYWRQSSYGPVAVYNSDLKKVGGFVKNIKGWGKEDVLLCESFLRANYSIYRAADPGLVHRYHTIKCDPKLERSQYRMCQGSRSNTYASSQILADIVKKYKIL